MTDNLNGGFFRIVSFVEGNPPIGVDYSKVGFQIIRVNEPVQDWTVKKVGDSYLFTIGGYPYTGLMDKKVTASTNPEINTEWIATYREAQKAYTISPANDLSVGWTVSPEFSVNPEIEISLIVSTKSIPPLFLPTQLFLFEPIIE